jgi:hypothetical protein
MLAPLVLLAAGLLLGFRLIFVWFSFALVLDLHVLVCLLPVGSLVVRSSGPVLYGLDCWQVGRAFRLVCLSVRQLFVVT